MKKIFSDYGINITKNYGKLYITFQDDRKESNSTTLEISKADAEIAMKGPEEAKEIVLKYKER